MYFQKALHRLRPLDGISSQFIAYRLRLDTQMGDLQHLFTGATIKHLTGKALARYEFPLPPLAEQKRIVAKVDQLMALCDELEEKQKRKRSTCISLNKAALNAVVTAPDRRALKDSWKRVQDHFEVLYEMPENVKELRQTILQLAVMGKLVKQDPKDEPAERLLDRLDKRRRELLLGGDPNDDEARTQLRKQAADRVPADLPPLPAGWAWSTLLGASHAIVDCHNKTAPYTKEGTRLIRTTNIRDGELNFTEPKFVSEETYKRWAGRCPPAAGDILVTREAPMGEACIIPQGMRLCMGQRMMLIRLVPETMVAEYVLLSIMSPDFMNRVQDKPVGATVKHLRVGGVETALLPVPPKHEQERIVRQLRRLLAVCDGLSSRLTAFESAAAGVLASIIDGLAPGPTRGRQASA